MLEKKLHPNEWNARHHAVVKYLELDGINYILRWVPCGNKRCHSCPHGPYWYAITRRHGKKRDIYIGKDFMTLKDKNYRWKMKKEQEHHEKSKLGSV